MPKLIVATRTLPDGQLFTVSGRDAWALSELVEAGAIGTTPIDNPDPRWIGYVLNLKCEHGLAIETRHEAHEGQCTGTHARYVLKSDVQILHLTDAPESEAA
jgi:hypothetical protein